MNKLKQIFNPIIQIAIWAFAAVIYLGGGKVNVAIHNTLLLLIVLIVFGLLLKVKETIDYYRHIEVCYHQLRHLLYLISKEHNFTESIINKDYRASLQEEIQGGKRTDEFKDKNSQKYKFKIESMW